MRTKYLLFIFTLIFLCLCSKKTNNSPVNSPFEIKYILSLSTNGNGNIQTNPSGNSFSAGTVVTITPSPAADSAFAGWSGIDDASVLNNQVIIDNNKTIIANFEPRKTLNTVQTVASHFPERRGHTMIAFNGELYIIGGKNGANDMKNTTPYDVYYNDVWKLSAGKWLMIRANGAANGFDARAYHSSVVFNNKIWVIGGSVIDKDINGNKAKYFFSDVWNSSDGKNWTQTIAQAAFGVRDSHSSVVFGGKIWVIAGWTGVSENSIYSSIDGITWFLETRNPGFTPRYNQCVVIFNTKIYLYGGIENDVAEKNDIYSSSNGTAFTQDSAAANFAARYLHSCTVHNSKVYITGGSGPTDSYSDSWSSSDAVNFTQDSNNSLPKVFGHQTTSFNGSIYLSGGSSLNSGTLLINSYNSVYTSSDGVTWSEQTTSLYNVNSFGVSSLFSSDGKVYLFAGGNSQVFTQRVWSSSDILTWIAEASPSFEARRAPCSVEFNNNIYIIGGTGVQDYNDVHKFSGGSWQKIVANAPFSGRHGHSCVVYNNQIYLIGGVTGTSFHSDVWSSPDALAWTKIKNDGDLTFARAYHSSIVYNGKIFIMAGFNGAALNDIFFSADGITWIKTNSSLNIFPARRAASLIIWDSKLWLFAGLDNGTGLFNDAWYSIDGINWSQAIFPASYTKRSASSAIVLGGSPYLIGGRAQEYYFYDIIKIGY